jgi:hypothetical protein
MMSTDCEEVDITSSSNNHINTPTGRIVRARCPTTSSGITFPAPSFLPPTDDDSVDEEQEEEGYNENVEEDYTDEDDSVPEPRTANYFQVLDGNGDDGEDDGNETEVQDSQFDEYLDEDEEFVSQNQLLFCRSCQ